VGLYNGLAYVADGTAGLQIVNFLAVDTAEQAPRSVDWQGPTLRKARKRGAVFTELSFTAYSISLSREAWSLTWNVPSIPRSRAEVWLWR
jgi:hypothetical protein